MSDSFWFPHDVDANGDEKLKLLIRKHEWRGYGIYWSLIERLHKNNNSLLRDYDGLAFDMRETCERMKSIVEDFKLFRLTDQNFSSDRVAKNLRERKEKRKKAKISAEKGWEKRKADAHANA